MKYYSILLLFLLIVIGFTCSHPHQPLSYSISNSERIKLERLKELQRSVLKITCTAYYQNYFYSYPTSDTISLLYDKNITTNSVAGTGLIIHQDSRISILLTCYHLFDFKDTLKTYYLDEHKKPTKFLYSLSIKVGQNILIFHRNGRSSRGKVLAFDEANDLALIGATPGDILLAEFPFKGSFVDTEEIKLGQEIYLLGFPKGFFMVTRGLASPTHFKNKFIVDAPFNKGFSGGVVIVFNDDRSKYQYVGMANSIAYNSETVLAPSEDHKVTEKYLDLPYTGDIFIKDLKLINYGITFVVKSNVISDFLKREKKKLRKLGYSFTVEFKK